MAVALLGAGCPAKPAPRTRTVHLDLSDMSSSEKRPGTYFLNAPLGRHPLREHDADSRNEIGDGHRLRETGRVDEATHYASGVEIPTDRLGLSTVTFVPEGQPHYELLALSMHPLSGLDLDNGTSASAAGAPDGSTENDLIAGSGLAHCTPDQPMRLSLDTAAALVFLHPEVTSLAPDEAARISCHLYNSNEVSDLALAIRAQSKARQRRLGDAGPSSAPTVSPA